jgi:ABC-type Mn2+/Zn2+ transport system ATPase subunit
VLDGLNLTISRGESYGLLGPNGAGKSTAVKLLLGLLRPESGKAWVLGISYGKYSDLDDYFLETVRNVQSEKTQSEKTQSEKTQSEKTESRKTQSGQSRAE